VQDIFKEGIDKIELLNWDTFPLDLLLLDPMKLTTTYKSINYG